MSLPLRFEQHNFTEESRVLLEVWRVVNGRALLHYKNPSDGAPLYRRLRGQEGYLTPEDEFEYLLALRRRINQNTFVQAFFDNKVYV